MTARPRPVTTSSQDGHIMILVIGLVVLALLLVTVVAAAASVYLGHKRLLALADGAALAAADTFVLAGGSSSTAPGTQLSDRGVTAAAAAFLAESPPAPSLAEVLITAPTGAPDGRTATVTLTAVVHPPFVNFLIPDGIALTAVGTARAQLVQ